ncbi:hypothetical protein CANARDRAFT_10138 [[Candida] arabinofermentans NRRL YB-2248]|uniref:HDA1 complex subunit 3 n=1 Tax=[Candida] arabinofermentans NRRL YB-2248 TaxID=983967 RepID=A0A1E4STT1_9ASCO|nr:hypothetical protein CANARDRAFT_10138 [[Candida] arabinofermentans NRRL YB-2248]
MDLLRILDAKPEPIIIDETHFKVSNSYQQSSDYKLPTPLSDFQKELIDQIISLHYSDVLKYVDNDDDNNEQEQIILDSINTMLLNTQLVCSHPYLLIDHYFPKSLTTRDIPKRLSETSGKFDTLSNLLSLMDSVYNSKQSDTGPVDVVIIARPGKTLDLIDALCIGHNCNFKRYSGIKLREANTSISKKNINLNIHLFASDDDEIMTKIPVNPLFLISFDISVDLSKLTQINTKIIRLVPINSIEHISLYYKEQNLDHKTYLKLVTSATVVLRDRVGQLPSELRPIYNLKLQFLKNFISNPSLNLWPLPMLNNIPVFNNRDVEKSLLTEVKFNFDNLDLISENIEFTSTTNSNKTPQMTKHIIQPRSHTNTTISNVNYYDSKRLLKKYLNNPLNLDYELLTGISKEIHLNEILTHTLIYKFNMKLNQLIKKNDELKSFDEYYNSRMQNYKEQLKMYNDITKDLNNCELEIKETNEKISLNLNEITKIKQNISILNDTLSNISKTKYIKIQDEITIQNENILKLKQKLNSNETDSKYMSLELQRASNSISDSKKIISEKQSDINTLNLKITQLKTQEPIEKLSILQKSKQEYESTIAKNENLMSLLDTLFKKLSIGETGRGRYVNYSRNGILSKRGTSPMVKHN